MLYDLRPARLVDIPEVVKLLKGYWDEMPEGFRSPAFNVSFLQMNLVNLISNKDWLTLVGEDVYTGKLVAAFAASCSPAQFWDDSKHAFEYLQYVKPEARGSSLFRKFIREYESWAEAQGAITISLGISSGMKHESAVRMYGRLGYQPAGILTKKDLT